MEAGRLRWRCRRGSRELELMLLAWLDRHYPQAGSAAQAAFLLLLELPEDQLQHALLGQESPADAEIAELVRQIRSAFNAGA